MKSRFFCCIALTVFLTAVNSCVIDCYDDSFSGTSWSSDEVPLGPLEVSELALDFLEDGRVTVRLEWGDASDELTLSGEYFDDGQTAVLQGLLTTVRTLDVTFIEAHLSGQTLFLLWRVENAVYPFTTALRRLE